MEKSVMQLLFYKSNNLYMHTMHIYESYFSTHQWLNIKCMFICVPILQSENNYKQYNCSLLKLPSKLYKLHITNKVPRL